MKIDYVLPDDITVRSVTGYQRGNTVYQADLDGTALATETFGDSVNETLWSEEFNMISPDKGFFTWIFGAYADADTYDFPSPYKFYINLATPLPGPAYRILAPGHQSKVGLRRFRPGELSTAQSLQLQIGARYTATKTTNHVDVLQYGTAISDEQSQKYVNTSGKVSLNWTIDPTTFSTASSRRASSPVASMFRWAWGTPAAFEAEKLTDYELGWKNTAFDGHLRTQVDGFYDNYNNFQVTVGYPQFPTFGFELNNPNTTQDLRYSRRRRRRYSDRSPSTPALRCDAQFARNLLRHGSANRDRYALQSDDRTHEHVVHRPERAIRRPMRRISLSTSARSTRFALPGNDSLTPRVNYGYVAPQWATMFENSVAGRPPRGAGHPRRATGLAACHLGHDAVRHQPDRPALRRGAQLRLELRRYAAPIWHPRPEDVLIRNIGRLAEQQPAALVSYSPL